MKKIVLVLSALMLAITLPAQIAKCQSHSSITVLVPTANSTLVVGQPAYINWKSVGIPSGEAVSIVLVDTRYPVCSRAASTVIATVKNSGSYMWEIRPPCNMQLGGFECFRIAIVPHERRYNGGVSGVFSIAYSPYLEMVSPNSVLGGVEKNTLWAVGSVQAVMFNTASLAGHTVLLSFINASGAIAFEGVDIGVDGGYNVGLVVPAIPPGIYRLKAEVLGTPQIYDLGGTVVVR